MQKLFISIDPGFDSLKVVANGEIFKIPFSVQETDERKMTDYGIKTNLLLYHDTFGCTYRVGAYAQDFIYEHKNDKLIDEQMDTFYSESRFTSKEFIVGLRTVIALSIEKNRISSTEPLDISLMVALPHAIREKYTAAVIGAVAGNHKFSLKHGETDYVTYQFSIKEHQIFTVSQTIAAIIGETSNDRGNINKEKFFYLTNGPTLVIDGGYYTMGLVSVSRGGSVDNEKTESDIMHAMRNVNIAIANEIKDKRPDIKHYVMEYMIQNNQKIRYMQDNKAHSIDLAELKKKYTKTICDDFIKYLNDKYNSLLDFNYIMVTGGTGASFFEQLKQYYVSNEIISNNNFLLANSELCGKTYSIEYSIAIGAYKGLIGVANK